MELMIIVLVVFILAALGYNWSVKQKRLERLGNYRNIRLGMHEWDVFRIMGEDYSRSLLKDGTVVYEWRIASSMSGFVYRNIVSMESNEAKVVTIYVKDGFVEEVKAKNI